MVNISIYEPNKTESLDIKDFEVIVSRELGDGFAQQSEDELINFIVNKEKVQTGQLVEITIDNISNFYIINDFGYEKVDIINENTFDLQSLANEKNKVDLDNLAKEQKSKTKKKVRISVIKKLAENKKIIKERDAESKLTK